MATEAKNNKKTSRRKFLVRGGLGTLGVIAIGTYAFRNPIRRKMLGAAETLIPPYAGKGTEANLWFEISKDNKVIFYSPKVEMGQGSFTGLAQMIADELDVDINNIQVKTPDTDSGILDTFSTGGSLTIAGLWKPLREMAATLREMIKSEAANKLSVDAAQIQTVNGEIKSGSSSLTYAEVLEGLTEWKLPKKAPLKSKADYKYIGKPVKRIDLEDKVNGAPIFGMDASLADMLHATVIRPEHIGSTLKSADTSEAEKMPGNIKIVKRDDWVGIVANSQAEALAAKNKVTVEWDIPKEWTEDELRQQLRVGNGNEMITQKAGKALDPSDSETVEMEFTSPMGAHAQIEPNGAVARVKDGKATIILSTQVIAVTQRQVAKALGLKKEHVNVVPTYLGGGFGRRLNTSHAVQAAIMSQEVGQPVKYFFTRKEEFQNDTFRPPTHHIMRGKLNSDGLLDGLEHHYASGDVAYNTPLLPNALLNALGTDIGAARGGSIMYEKIPNHRAVQWHQTLPFATSWWRSLGLLANTFAIESFVDEMAIKANKNPVDFRLASLGDDLTGQRIKSVITMAAEKGNYNDKASGNKAMGFAASIDAGSPSAHVVEIELKDNNEIRVNKVTCVLDCGLAVNPDQVRAQCEGSIIMGISAALHEKMTIRNGRLYPLIYGAYDMALMRNSPKEIDVHLIQGVDDPLPVGEPPLGPIGAAIGNAIKRLTGKRLTDMPMKLA